MTAADAGAERPTGAPWRARSRHTNPGGGWTRFATTLPLLIAAVSHRVRIGWRAAPPVALVPAWIRASPRAFPATHAVESRASRNLLGGRVRLARGRSDGPAHRCRTAQAATGIAAAGAAAMPWGWR